MKSAVRVLLLFVGLAVLIPVQAGTVFKIATIAPDGTSWMTEMRKGADEIEKATQGRVQIRYYPGGVMGNDMSVPDQAASVEPGGFERLVKYIRVTEASLGDGVKKVYASEQPSLKRLRRVNGED